MAPALIEDVAGQPMATHKSAMTLTPVEATLKKLLLDVSRYIDDSTTSSNDDVQASVPGELTREPIVLRFTGGWVRDKLLGVGSHDIDVAINKMTGYQFGLRIKEYLEIPGNLEKYGLDAIASDDKQDQKAGTSDKSKAVGGLHKIEANPEKSKHLETTTMRILGLDIDLVNLRKETYSEDSRNPQMEFGTAEEDALRRDATVNAMFYNLNTERVEDFTGRGHQDMQLKLLRTPLEPYQTFKDDPLRVLRLVRFASRLGYTLEESVSAAMKDSEIKEALRRKISRERVGVEMEKSLQGPDPHEALRLVFEHDLYLTIFSDPNMENSKHFQPDLEGWQTIIGTLRDIIGNADALAEDLIRDKEEEFLAWQLAAFVPYRHAPRAECSDKGKRTPPWLAVVVAREGIKATNKVCDLLATSVHNKAEITNVVDGVNERKRRPNATITDDDVAARDTLGMAIRRWGFSWRGQVIYSFLTEVADNLHNVNAIERKYTAFVNHVRDSDLFDVCSLKPLLDGKALAKALDMRPGPWMKDALDVVMAWQLRHRDAQDPQSAIEQVRNHQKQGELTSSLVHHFLKLTIRPFFSKSSLTSITPQARKAVNAPLPTKFTAQMADEADTKPWKSIEGAQALELLAWVTRTINSQLLAKVWPMLIPPILTLLDDTEIQYKRMGAELLQTLLNTTPPDLLDRTGLGEVFEEALLPCLTYLPPLTPSDESHSLLSVTYPTLLSLTKTRFQPPPLSSPNPTLPRKYISALSTILRKGILHTFTSLNLTPRHPQITQTLLANMAAYLDAMGIDSVTHLRYVVPITTSILAHPLVASLQISTLLAALQAQQAILRNCWPRMAFYAAEVLKGLTACWLAACELDGNGTGGEGRVAEQEGEVRELCLQLREAFGMLHAAITASNDCGVRLEEEVQKLMEVDGRLAGLFKGVIEGEF